MSPAWYLQADRGAPRGLWKLGCCTRHRLEPEARLSFINIKLMSNVQTQTIFISQNAGNKKQTGRNHRSIRTEVKIQSRNTGDA